MCSYTLQYRKLLSSQQWSQGGIIGKHANCFKKNDLKWWKHTKASHVIEKKLEIG